MPSGERGSEGGTDLGNDLNCGPGGVGRGLDILADVGIDMVGVTLSVDGLEGGGWGSEEFAGSELVVRTGSSVFDATCVFFFITTI